MRRVIVGITTDLAERPDGRLVAELNVTYADAVARAGAVPVALVPDAALAAPNAASCDAIIFTGGDDPAMEPFGEPTHPKATPMHPRRQDAEVALLRFLAAERPDMPVLGICLGMQLMSLVAGGRMHQHLPDTFPDHANHWNKDHAIISLDAPTPEMVAPLVEAWRAQRTPVHSKHRQAVAVPGCLSVIARSHDGLIEAVADPRRRFYVGVQWHPERTSEAAGGLQVVRGLVVAAGG